MAATRIDSSDSKVRFKLIQFVPCRLVFVGHRAGEAEGLEALLNDPDFQAKRSAEIPEMVEKLDVPKAKVARLYTRWEELEAVREASA